MALFRRATNENVEDTYDDSDDMFNLLPSWSKENTGAYGAVRMSAETAAASMNGHATQQPLPTYKPAPWTISPKPSASPPPQPPVPSFSSVQPSAAKPPPPSAPRMPAPRPQPPQMPMPTPRPQPPAASHMKAHGAPISASAVSPAMMSAASEMARSESSRHAAEAAMPQKPTTQEVTPSTFRTVSPDAQADQHAVASGPFFVDDDFDDYDHEGDDYDHGDDESFYDANSDRKARFLGPIIFVTIALLCVGAGVYYVTQANSKKTGSTGDETSLTSARESGVTTPPATDQTVPSTSSTTSTPPTTKAASPKTTLATAPKATTPTTAAPSASGPKPGQICNIYSDGTTVGCEGFDLSKETMPIRVKLPNGQTITCPFNDQACRARTQ